MNYKYVILNLFILHYIIILYYIILYYVVLNLTFILLLIQNLFKGSHGKFKLETSRLWQLDNSWRKDCERRLMVEGVAPSKVYFSLLYIFFEFMLMSRIDGIRDCLEDYILFLFDECMYT